MQDAHILHVVVPAEAGTRGFHCKPLGSRHCGDDVSFADAVAHIGNPLKKQTRFFANACPGTGASSPVNWQTQAASALSV